MTEKARGGFFGSSFLSSVSSSVNAFSQTLQTKGLPEMNKRLNELQQKARELPSQIKHLQGDLESERVLFVEQNKNGPRKGSEPVAPWVGYYGYDHEMKQAIMDISKDERNFLIAPPEDTNFQFDLNAYSLSAQAALKQDEKLSQMRFLLVPQQVKEPMFWRNYFYRVTIVKQTVLSHPPSSTEDGETVLFDFKEEEEHEEEEEEKPITPAASPIEKDKDQNYDGMEEWEIELRKAAII